MKMPRMNEQEKRIKMWERKKGNRGETKKWK